MSNAHKVARKMLDKGADVKEEQKRLERLQQKSRIAQSGYGGVDKQGRIVDRREQPDATAIPGSTPLGVPEPKPVPKK